jgi:4-amino-4-deoxy-L-arabinose transferase-like glycosyltransferase
MKLVLPKKPAAQTGDDKPSVGGGFHLPSWLFYWEVYLIVLIAAGLRLYHIDFTEFDGDQANIFRMAYGAWQHGMLVATANGASIRTLNPPAVIYLLMIPAAFSANPLGAAIFQALLSVAAVLLTYLFTRRYYGRLVGTIAALTFATSARAVFYSRFIWNQNFIPFFLLLLLFALFYGAVERRKGWLFPALFLVGFLVQLHPTCALLLAPLLVALVLAPGTLRWRDLVFGIVSLLVIYAPFILWEISSHFYDVQILLNTSKLPSQMDTQALTYYQWFLSPYATLMSNGEPFSNTHSIIFHVYHRLSWLQPLLTGLLIAGIITALLRVLRSQHSLSQEKPSGNVLLQYWRSLRLWWSDLRATPYRCGLLILLVWQLVPLLALSRHVLPIYPHYLIIFMPGQYILIGLFIAEAVRWCRRWRGWRGVLRFALCALAALVVCAQSIGATGMVLDTIRGNYHDTDLSSPYYNDLSSLQHALNQADQIAQLQHIQRIYIAADVANVIALTFLAEQIQTPVTLFNGAHCAVLPNPANGPAVLLVGPRSQFVGALVSHFTQATLVDQPRRPGGPPFQLYLIGPTSGPSIARGTFQGHLEALATQTAPFSFHNAFWNVARWRLLHSVQPDFRVTYGYKMAATSDNEASNNNRSVSNQCAFSSIRSGDQLLMAFPQTSVASTSLTIRAQFYTISPDNFSYGPLTFETDKFLPIQWTMLHTEDKRDSLSFAFR